MGTASVALGPADVIVCGAGPGGLAAATEAARAGASVVLVEARDTIGGTGVLSTGYIPFVGSPLQAEASIEDSEERFVSDMLEEVERQRSRYGILFDNDLAYEFAHGTRETWSFLTEIGFTFRRLIPRPQLHRTDRMVDITSTQMFIELFGRELARLGVRIVLRTRVERLIVEDGRVSGVRTLGSPSELRTGAVVLATGGYPSDPSLRAHYQPDQMNTGSGGLDTSRGDGHRMAQSVGADMINMTFIPPQVRVASGLVEDSIAIDRTGRRFHDEAGPYDDRIDALLSTPGRVAWYLCDARAAEARAQYVAIMPEPHVQAGSLDQIAQSVGCPPETLRETVANWNALVGSGVAHDPEFGRVVFPASGRGIEQPPFHLLPMTITTFLTCGGARVDRTMRVLDVYGAPIPGLYAVGDCVGGINPATALGGIHLGSALTLGRVAGRAAAAERSTRTIGEQHAATARGA